MQIDRIDFIENEICHRCKRPLKSNIAHILIDGHGNEFPYGKICAERTAANTDYPNFTKWNSKQSGHNNKMSARQKKGFNNYRDAYDEIEYLRLRMEKLEAFNGMKTKKLYKIYVDYKKSKQKKVTSSLEAITYLKNLITYTKREKLEYSPAHLQICYAYEFWLSKIIKTKTKPDFFISLRKHLRKDRFLSEKQVAALNKEHLRPIGIKDFQYEDFKLSPRF